MVAVSGCMGMLNGEEDTDPVEYVPSDADTLVHVDMAVAEDEDTQKLADAFAASSSSDDVEDSEDVFKEFKNETGLDLKEVSDVTLYTIPNEGAEWPEPQQHMGFVLYSDWSEDELISTIEEEEDYNYTTTEKGDVTVYEPDVSEDYMGEPMYVAVLEDGTYVLGDEAAVNGAADVAAGNADPVDGELKTGFEEVNDGYVTFAYEVSAEDIPEQNPNQQIDTSAFKDVSVIAGSYNTDDGTVVAESKLYVESEDSATDVKDVTDGMFSMLRGTAPSEDVKDELRSVEVTQDGDVVTVTYEGDVETLSTIIEEYMSQTAGTTTY